MSLLALAPCVSARYVHTTNRARNLGRMSATGVKMQPIRYAEELRVGGGSIRRLQAPFVAYAMPHDEDFEEEEEEADYEYEDSYDFELEPDSSMRLYLDSADVKTWQQWAEAGLFYGVVGWL